MKYDIVIIGAGIVGLATALKIKEKKEKLDVLLLEKEDDIALHQTGNNSGVIHSGIYYEPDGLKARNCLKGYRMLIDFCRRHSIPYQIRGKLVVATKPEELSRLQDLYENGLRNGLTKIRKLTREEIREFEPHCSGLEALHVPYTGIVDFSEVSLKIASLFTKRYQGKIMTGRKVTGLCTDNEYIRVNAGDDELRASLVVNTAGLFSDEIAAMAVNKLNVRIIPFRGEYYRISGERESLVNHLIYPVPDPGFPFLGVHFTRLIGGGIEAGPNAVFAFRKEGYKKTDFSLRDTCRSFSWPGFIKVMWKYWKTGLNEYHRSFSKAAFTRSLQRLVPEITKSDLLPGGTGVRAQACSRSGKLIDDFMIIEEKRSVHVLNAPSPAATASLSIGETIAEKVVARL